MIAARAITASRLDLVPLRPADAEEMVEVLADPRLYHFIGGDPPSRQALQATYERPSVGRSPDGSEAWLNWIVRLRPTGSAIGFVQATVLDAGTVADVAWLIGVPWQGRGFAVESARAVIAWLGRRGVRTVVAHIRPDHEASARVAARLGLEATDDVDGDGERIWRLALQAAGRTPR